MTYSKKAHWPERQKILRNTVQEELFSPFQTPLSKIPWLGEKIYGDNHYDEQCESFCVFLYCIHVLGDYIEAGEEKKLKEGGTRTKTFAEKRDGINYLFPLSHVNDRDNPGIIPELIKNSEILFATQKGSNAYKSLYDELIELRDKSDDLYSSKGDSEEKVDEYIGYANKLLDILGTKVPDLLRNEQFFANAFYNN